MAGVHLAATVRSRHLDVAVDVPSGRTLALIGLNGSGKSTVLAVLAGLLVPDAGLATLGGRTLFDVDPDTGDVRTWVPAHKRRAALLAQDPLLFPHLDVVGNVAFGPRSAGRRNRDARARAQRWLSEVDAADLADRPARALSGGQAQRVALARALAAEPDVLLLDEPLAALDVDVAVSVRNLLRRVVAGRTAVLVTHDVLDVALLADDVVVLDSGRVVEQGPVGDLLRAPRSPFSASLFGLNLLTGTAIAPDVLRTADGRRVQGQPDLALGVGEPAIAVFPPAAVSVHRIPPSGSPRNLFTGRITSLEPLAHLVRVRVDDLKADITPAAVAQLGLAPGDDVHLAVKAAEVVLSSAPRR